MSVLSGFLQAFKDAKLLFIGRRSSGVSEDVDAVCKMLSAASVNGVLVEVVVSYGDHIASGDTPAVAAMKAMWDFDV